MNTKHVPDLELCQELDRLCKEKGIVVPETEFYWAQWDSFTPKTEPYVLVTKEYYDNEEFLLDAFPAPLVSEQGEWSKTEKQIFTNYVSDEDDWVCVYKEWNPNMLKQGQYHATRSADTEANARQKMLNHLITEGIITNL